MIIHSDRTVVTCAVHDWAEAEHIRMVWLAGCLAHHLAGDWGDLDAHDRAANDHALRRGQGRLLSAYETLRLAVTRPTERPQAAEDMSRSRNHSWYCVCRFRQDGGSVSALSIGATAFVDDQTEKRATAAIEAAGVQQDPSKEAAVKEAVAPTKEDALSVIIKWVPGEIIGTYAAVIAALQVTSEDNPDRATGAEGWLLAVFGILSFLITILGANIAYRKLRASGSMPGIKRTELFVRAGLACIGLGIWSYVIPGSVTNQSGLAETYSGAASAMIFLIAIAFGLFAEWLVLPATLRGLRKRRR